MTSNARYFRNIWIVIILIILSLALSFGKGYFAEKIRQKNVLGEIDKQRLEDCRKKTMVHHGKQTADCKVINNFSPTGNKWDDDCGRSVWAYSTVQCVEYRYFSWQTWSDSMDEKNVWINGNQYYRSCQWPKNVPDEELKSIDCRYDFLEKILE